MDELTEREKASYIFGCVVAILTFKELSEHKKIRDIEKLGHEIITECMMALNRHKIILKESEAYELFDQINVYGYQFSGNFPMDNDI